MIKDIETREKFAYAAGILDGEGSICIRHHKEKPELHAYHPYLGISNTSLDLMNWFQEFFGGYVCKRNLTLY